MLFLHYCITHCPNVEMLSLHVVTGLYRYRFGHMCTRYRYRKIGSVIAFLSYRFWNIVTVIAFI